MFLGAIADGAVMLSASAGPDTHKKSGIHCGDIVKAAASAAGGSGSGGPMRAQAGAKDIEKISLAFEKAGEYIRKACHP